MRPIAIAQRFGTTKSAVNDALARARKNLERVGIKLPIKPDAGQGSTKLAKVRTVDPFALGEMVEG